MLPQSTAARPHTTWPVAVAIGIGGSLIVAFIVLAFLWPAKTTQTHNLPVSIAGPPTAVSALQDAMQQAGSDTIEFVPAVDRDDAVQQIQTRQTYGAIVLTDPVPSGAGPAPEVLTAPAASAAAAQVLTAVATQVQAQLTQQATAAGDDSKAALVTVTAVVPLSATDPTGAGLAAASFPMMLGGMIGGVLVSLLVVGPLRRLAALAGFAAASGIILTLLLQTWFEFLQGGFWLNVLGIGLSILATASFIVGCASLLGTAGIGVAALVTVLFANPISAASGPWQFLAQPWGAIGQYFVPGASNWLLRSLSYFPDANNAKQWWVLLGWTALGVALTLAGHYRGRATMHVPGSTLEAPMPLTPPAAPTQ